MFDFMGIAVATCLELWPEEALYLMEGSQLGIVYILLDYHTHMFNKDDNIQKRESLNSNDRSYEH